MADAPRILFAGGGTGGHVYPAIAIADAVKRLSPGAEIEFAGTRAKMEWEAVPKAGYRIHPITISGLHRGQPWRNVALPLKVVKSLLESRRLVREFNPHVAVGTGGYVSGPVLMAASLAGRPILIQEQNAFAGMTNKLLGKRAARIHVAFEEAKRYFPPGRSILSGNPTRRELLEADPAGARRHFDFEPGQFVIAVFGGSLGSRAINEAMIEHVNDLLSDDQIGIIWQTGKQYFDRVRRLVRPNPRLRLLQYVDRMDLAYAAADLAICRAGAITCSELMVTGTPSILVPSPNVAEDHQTHNARSMQSAGAAVLLPEAEMQDRLLDVVLGLRGDEERLAEMGRAARRIARPDAADRIARDVLSLAGFEPDPETSNQQSATSHGPND